MGQISFVTTKLTLHLQLNSNTVQYKTIENHVTILFEKNVFLYCF